MKSQNWKLLRPVMFSPSLQATLKLSHSRAGRYWKRSGFYGKLQEWVGATEEVEEDIPDYDNDDEDTSEFGSCLSVLVAWITVIPSIAFVMKRWRANLMKELDEETAVLDLSAC